MIQKEQLLKTLLLLGALYYLIGSIVHLFGLTLWPWYDHVLYSPYHDSLIALLTFIIAAVMFVVARDTTKNKDILKVIIGGILLASLFSIIIIWKIDFVSLGSPTKKLQTIIEGIMGLIYFGLLLWLYPKE